MNVSAVIQMMLHGNQLKRTVRTGWLQRGVPQPESVAAHSFGVTYIVLILSRLMGESVDTGKLLAMAALHDLPEGLTTDIPTPAWRYLPPGIKMDVERSAMKEILTEVPFAPELMAIWEELHTAETIEARLVADADKLDMYLQAFIYEQQFGNLILAEFWQTPPTIHFPQTRAIYNELLSRRNEGVGT